MERLERCDALDLLEEAALTRRRVTITVDAGDPVSGRVRDVVTEDGEDHVVLDGGQRVAVSRVVQVERRLDPADEEGP